MKYPGLGRGCPWQGKVRGEMKFSRPVGVFVLAFCLALPCRFEVARAEEPALENLEYPTLDSFFTLYQPYLGNISAYKPIFFLVGTNTAKSKFQFSFRYRFFNSEGPLALRHPWLNGLHFGYTQTSFWDLKSDSKPFEDTSYKPELFHLSRNFVSGRAALQGFFLQTGLQHESNGRAEGESRSSNILYVQPVLIIYEEASRLGLQFSPRFWIYASNSGAGNGDLADYRGYFELEAKAGKADNLVFSGTLRWAREGASGQLDLTYPVHQYLSYLHAEYVNALAESLLNFRERTEAFRLGISFIR
jgi:outer membrane phospholipase A